jgi:transposase-like protein
VREILISKNQIKVQLFCNGKTADCARIDYTTNYTSANTLSFESDKYYNDETLVHLYVDGKMVFGGQVDKVNESENPFKHNVVDFSKKLNNPITDVFKKGKTSSQIAKAIAKKQLLGTGGIKATKKKHPQLAWEKAKALDIMYQLAELEDKHRFYINTKGKPILEKIPSQEKGYVFTPENIIDYGIEYDSSNLITGVKVIGVDSGDLYNFSDKKLQAKYGVITEIINDSKIQDKKTATNKGKSVFKKRSKKVISGNLEIPSVLPDLFGGQYCAFNMKGSPSKLKTWWVDSVSATISGSGDYRMSAVLLDGKPDPPDSWIYKPPDEKKTACTKQQVCNKAKAEGSCGTCTKKPAVIKDTVCFEDYCPKCDKYGVLQWNPTKEKVPRWGCKKCNAKFCAKCGKQIGKAENVYLKKSGKCEGGGKVVNVAGVPQSVRDKASTFASAYDAVKWVKNNVKYRFYYNHQVTVDQQMKGHRANCYDQSALVVAILKTMGHSAQRMCGRRCGKYAHCNVDATINGVKYLIDTACGSLVYKRR